MRAVLLVLSIAGIALPACSPRPAMPLPIPSGREIAERKCASCHAIGDNDSSPNPIAPPLRSLYRRYPVDGLREAFASGMEVGHRDMPRFTLAPAEIDQLVNYLRSLNPCGKPSSDKAAMRACFAPMAP
jgi:mono/diheme cytochrome c family protein